LLRRDVPISNRICQFLRQGDYDLVHSNDNPRGDRSILLAALRCRVPVVSHVRFSHVFDRHVEGTLSRGVKHYIYVSKAVRERFESSVGHHVRGTVIYDPLTIPPLEDLEAQAIAFRRAENLEQARLIVNVARVVPWKGLHIYVEALADVLPRFPDAVGLIVGDPADDPSYSDYLRRLVDSYGIGDRLRFTGFRPDALAVMAASEVVVHSAVKPEPFGRVVVEAMSLGRPVIAAEAGGPLESVRSGVDGILVSPGDPVALGAAISRVLTRPEEGRSLGKAGALTVRERYSPEHYAESLLHIYDEVLSAGS